MRVFLIRHGESSFNKAEKHQDGRAGLSKAGIRQAEQVSEKLLQFKLDIIISSKHKRAAQTADIISKKLGLGLDYTYLLNERKNPSEIIGKKISDPSAIKVRRAQERHITDPKWHYSDEENFSDFKERTLKAVEYLGSLDYENIVAVTHSHMIRSILGVMAFGNAFTPHHFNILKEFVSLENAGITICRKKDGRWELLTLNDYAHILPG
jgi:broad specificity phosphatase PhoE